MTVKRMRLEDLPPLGEAEEAALRRLADRDDAEIDLSDIPELDAEWFREAAWRRPPPAADAEAGPQSDPQSAPAAETVAVALDRDVVDFFRADRPDGARRVSAALRALMKAVRRRDGS